MNLDGGARGGVEMQVSGRVGGTETFVRGEDAGARGGGDTSGGTCGVDLVDGGAGRRNLPHKLSDLPPHRT